MNLDQSLFTDIISPEKSNSRLKINNSGVSHGYLSQKSVSLSKTPKLKMLNNTEDDYLSKKSSIFTSPTPKAYRKLSPIQSKSPSGSSISNRNIMKRDSISHLSKKNYGSRMMSPYNSTYNTAVPALQSLHSI